MYPVESLTQFAAFYDFSAATAAAIPMLIVTVIILVLEIRLLHTSVLELSAATFGGRNALIELGLWRFPLFGSRFGVDFGHGGHCHAASGLRSRWRFGSQGDEEDQLSRLPLSARDHPAGDLALSPVPLSLRDVEDLLAERGIMVSYETVRRSVDPFSHGRRNLRKRRPKPHTTWHLDEVYLKIAGRMVYLWRAVDAEGEVLDVLVQSRRNKRAALNLMRKLLKKYGFVPDKLVTDNLRSYAAAASDLGITRRHERGRWRNNQAENSQSTDPTTRIQDAGFQVSGVSPKISLNSRSHLQHFQRPTSSHFCKDAPSLSPVRL